MAEIKDIDKMISEIRDFEDELEQLKAVQSKIREQVEERERAIMSALEESELKAFKGSRGAVSVVSRWSVKMPKDPAAKDELRKVLEEKNAFDGLWTINHQSLNSYFKEEKAVCDERGEMIDLPGLNPVEDKFLSFRKA